MNKNPEPLGAAGLAMDAARLIVREICWQDRGSLEWIAGVIKRCICEAEAALREEIPQHDNMGCEIDECSLCSLIFTLETRKARKIAEDAYGIKWNPEHRELWSLFEIINQCARVRFFKGKEVQKEYGQAQAVKEAVWRERIVGQDELRKTLLMVELEKKEAVEKEREANCKVTCRNCRKGLKVEKIGREDWLHWMDGDNNRYSVLCDANNIRRRGEKI